jgi:hypothetical protein
MSEAGKPSSASAGRMTRIARQGTTSGTIFWISIGGRT